jgi:hypothetical protein
MIIRTIAPVLVAGSLLIGGCTQPGQSAVERGKYLVTVMDCNGCHTPFKNGEPDMTRMLSGHPEEVKITAPPNLPADGLWAMAANQTNTAWAGPWGVSFTVNLTPDESTGIGSWSEDTFVKAIRTGRHMGVSREILPPMPWRMQARMTDTDLKAIYAYLKTVPPIRNRVPDPVEPEK